ncbi:hypothetical protein SAMN06296952_2060 [Oscillospiraceae bacterium]|nr:hypothetical protein SAMN06296952_2060 [Oscillospiraceae bacterium]
MVYGYMNNSKNDQYYIEKIRTDLKFISKHMKDVDLNIVFQTLKEDIPDLLEQL